ncbi:transposable element Tcb2 transposase [Trichonephila clavipes]|uniref:Transposable element Tcb2 transposase n=1 Tax=Trichonephila clavipes TaxID=2585209 RepID=A0A8X6SA67_TRICX|nr:transposable element Tcb2 transposase [Trichonephila clavipes]
MNPIEHVWDALGRRVAGRQRPPQTLQELERALLEEWDRIPQLVINSLIDSMPQRLFFPFLSLLSKGAHVTYSRSILTQATINCRVLIWLPFQEKRSLPPPSSLSYSDGQPRFRGVPTHSISI